MTSTAAEELPTDSELISRVTAVVPLLKERAPEIAELGVLTRDVVEAMQDAGVWQFGVPPQYGGPELPTTSDRVAIFNELGRGTAAAGWAVMNNYVNAHDVLHLGGPGAEEFFGTEHVGPLVAGSGPNFSYNVAFAEPVEGGYMVYGRWGFASNIRMSAWLAGSASRINADGTETIMRLLIPRRDFRIADDWHVGGMAGSNSNTAYILETEKAFVPDTHGWETGDYFPGLEAVTDLGAIAIGAATGALEEFIERAQKRAPMGLPYKVISDMATTHALVGRTHARIEIAKRALLSYAHRIDVDPPAEQDMAAWGGMYYEVTLICNDMRDLAIDLTRALGSSTVLHKDRLGIYSRDLEVVTSHGARVDWSAEARGRAMLGLTERGEWTGSSSTGPRVIPTYTELEETDERAVWFKR